MASHLPSVLAEVAPIYRALARPQYEAVGSVLAEVRRAFTPSEVDDMELWLIAELLGINESPAAQTGMTEQQFREQAAALNAERVRRAQAGEAPPEAPRSATPDVTPDMIAALAERRRQREAVKTGA